MARCVFGEQRAIGARSPSVLADQSVDALLWVALYQLIHTGAPAHAVVDEAVRATAQLGRTSRRA